MTHIDDDREESGTKGDVGGNVPNVAGKDDNDDRNHPDSTQLLVVNNEQSPAESNSVPIVSRKNRVKNNSE